MWRLYQKLGRLIVDVEGGACEELDWPASVAQRTLDGIERLVKGRVRLKAIITSVLVVDALL